MGPRCFAPFLLLHGNDFTMLALGSGGVKAFDQGGPRLAASGEKYRDLPRSSACARKSFARG